MTELDLLNEQLSTLEELLHKLQIVNRDVRVAPYPTSEIVTSGERPVHSKENGCK